MKKKTPFSSFMIEFAYIWVLIFLIIVGISSFITFYSIDTHKNKIIASLEVQSNRIERTLDDIFTHTSDIIRLMTTQIATNDLKSKDIEKILKQFKTDFGVSNSLAWTIFSWADDYHMIKVDAYLENMENSSISLADRDYIPRTVTHPGKIQLGSPVLGSTSRTWMIPAGIGVTNKNNQFIGTMTIGFNISKLVTLINNSLTMEGIDFAVIDKNFRFVLKNTQIKDDINDFLKIEEFNKLYKNASLNSSKNRSFSNVNLISGDAKYVCKIKNYPYLIVVSYKDRIIYDNIWIFAKDKLYSILILFSIFTLLLSLIYFRLIKPLMTLSMVADQISKGNKLDKFPRHYSHEINMMYIHLLRLKKLLIFEEKSREKIIRSTTIAQESDKARQEFIKSIQLQTKDSMNTILHLTQLLTVDLLHATNKLTHAQKSDYLSSIFHSTLHIKNMTSGILNISHFKIYDIINHTIKIYAKEAHQKNINIDFEIESDDENELICADEVKVKQIILGLVSRSIQFSATGTKITIIIENNRNNDKKYIVITVKDNSFGLSNNDRKRIEDLSSIDLDQDDYVRLTNLSTIIKLVQLHKGDINFEDIYGVGSTVIVTLPINNDNEKNNSKHLSTDLTNIIQFKKEEK